MASAVRERCDVAVVGAGMAGASLAYELSQRGLDVVVIEREPQPGYHSTGRSAAFFAPWYGNPTVRAVSRVSRAFFERPPEGFAAHPLATPRACVLYAGSAQRTAFERLCADVSAEVSVQVLDGADRVRALLPMLRPQAAERAFVDRSSFDIDVHALLHGYLRAARARGVRVATGFELESAQRDAGRWRLAGRGGEVSAATVAVCAGAWADSLASLFGAEPLGIEPRRRTVIVFQA
ncbi:MAG TPA: FAD-dependent oxidoreductase, partial [Burkholderiaceae bacterium]|nr:FAD-dependent oxidoreductase [Burkholderiaceae bacterium]